MAPSTLRVLDLSGNALSGPLPLAWSAETTDPTTSAARSLHLCFLNLSHNMLTGTLPPGWWQGVLSARDGGSGRRLASESDGWQGNEMLVDLSYNRLVSGVVGRVRGRKCAATGSGQHHYVKRDWGVCVVSALTAPSGSGHVFTDHCDDYDDAGVGKLGLGICLCSTHGVALCSPHCHADVLQPCMRRPAQCPCPWWQRRARTATCS